MTELKEGTPFSAERLGQDIQALYNTGVLYEISADVTKVSESEIDITMKLEDKWTLLPVAGAKGGGGSLTVGGGLLDANVGGYFFKALLIGYSYNGVFSYFGSVSHDNIAGKQLIGRIKWADDVNPTLVHNIDGSANGEFSWRRQSRAFMIGRHFGVNRVTLNTEIFSDSLLEAQNVQAFVYSGNQYLSHLKLALGTVNRSDYLEKGTELTFQFSSANYFGPAPAYQSAGINLKQVFVVNQNQNFGYFIRAAQMTQTAPPPYQFLVGGYDSIRGFMTARQIGPYTLYNNIEYRPLLTFSGSSFLDAGPVAIQGCVFNDMGAAWGDSTLTRDSSAKNFNLLWSMGAGLRFNFIHFAGVIVRVDVARTLRPDEGLGVSFGVGQFF